MPTELLLFTHQMASVLDVANSQNVAITEEAKVATSITASGNFFVAYCISSNRRPRIVPYSRIVATQSEAVSEINATLKQ